MPIFLLQRCILYCSLSTPIAFRLFKLSKPIRYFLGRKNLPIASEAQSWIFFTVKGVCLPLWHLPMLDPAVLFLLPPCLVAYKKLHALEENVTQGACTGLKGTQCSAPFRASNLIQSTVLGPVYQKIFPITLLLTTQ